MRTRCTKDLYVTYEVQREQTFFKAPCMGQLYICIQKCMLAAAALVSKACRLQFLYIHACICVQAPNNCCGIQNAWRIWHDIQLADEVKRQKKTVGLEIAYRAGATS